MSKQIVIELPDSGIDFEQVQEQIFLDAYSHYNTLASNNCAEVARLIRMNRTTLVERLKKRGITVCDFREYKKALIEQRVEIARKNKENRKSERQKIAKQEANEAREMRKKGLSIQEISIKMKRSYSWVYDKTCGFELVRVCVECGRRRYEKFDKCSYCRRNDK